MAEFLIKAVDATNPDPIKDARGCYKRGDIVQVFEDGECKEAPAPDSPFVIVKVTGITKAQALKYMQSHIDTTDPLKPITLKRRLYNIDYTLLSPTIINTLRDTKQLTVTATQVKTFIRNKLTNSLG